MAMAAGHVAVQGVIGGEANNTSVLLLLATSGALIFIDNARNGKPQSFKQYVALGIVGFVLLFIGEFSPELAFGFALLIFISIIFNSPTGLPLLTGSSKSKTKKKTAANTTTINIGKATNDSLKGL